MSAIDFKCFEGQPRGEVLEGLAEINEAIFGFGETAAVLAGLFEDKKQVLICMAYQDGNPVGYKFGYQVGPMCFESDRGGVLESARRQGIAQTLMEMQHDWCRAHDFKVVKTITNSDNRSMLILNLKAGFEIVGTFVNRNKRLKVVQEKWLG